MSTEAIIVLAVAAIILIALFIAISRSSKMREQRRIKQQRQQAAERHREAANVVQEEASHAEVQAQQAREHARRAEVEAREAHERAALHEERAHMHEKGLADHELPGREDEQPTGYANETDHADTAREGQLDPRDERSGVIGDGTHNGRFARDEGTTRTDVESGRRV